jgi:hypothetical protein
LRRVSVFWLCFLLIGCRVKRKNETVFRRFKKKNNEFFVMQINGVECRQCAIAALKRLKAVTQIDHVDCVCPRGHYEKASFECYIKKNKEKSLPLTEMHHSLGRDDFEIKSLGGVFEGIVTEDQQHFIPILFDIPFLIKYSPYHLFPDEEKNKQKKTKTFSGALNFDENVFYVN